MSEIDFVPFATAPGANVQDLTAYQADPATANGYVNGPADPQNISRALRQATIVSTSLATFISGVLGVNVIDDGNIAIFVELIAAAVSTYPPGPQPANPASGWRVYTDEADGTLKAVDAAGTVRPLVAP